MSCGACKQRIKMFRPRRPVYGRFNKTRLVIGWLHPGCRVSTQSRQRVA